MSSLFGVFKSKGKDKKSGENGGKKSDGRWATSRTAGSTSDKTLLVNATNKKLVLRDKVGSSYGTTRYEIDGNSEIEVTTLQHTFFKMIPYAIVEVEEEGKPTKTKRSVDTKLTIDSDRLADCKKIVISAQDPDKYKLDFESR